MYNKRLWKEQCLLVAVDDATGLVEAKFDKNEGKMQYLSVNFK